MVMAAHPERYAVFALVAGANWRLLADQCLLWRPVYAVLADETEAQQLRDYLASKGSRTEVLSGLAAMEQVAGASDLENEVAAIVGAVGGRTTLAAVKACEHDLLAK